MDYAKYLPLEPDEDVWACWEPEDFIIYRSAWYTDPITELKEPAVDCRCTACGSRWLSGKWYGGGNSAPFGLWLNDGGVASGHQAYCPECGKLVRAMHVGSFRTRICQDYFPMTVGRIGDNLVLLGWVCQREVGKWGEVYQSVKPYEAYVVEPKKVVKLTGYTKVITTIHLNGVWKQLKRCVDTWLNTDQLVGFTPEDLLGTTAENSKLDLYMQTKGDRWPVSYLRLWVQHRNVENLLTAGAGDFLSEQMRDYMRTTWGYYPRDYMPGIPPCNDINWKEKQPTKMLGLNRDEMRWMISMKWTSRELRCYKALREAQGPTKLPEDMEIIREATDYYAEEAIERGWPLRRMVRYCQKRADRTMVMLRDYWNMAEKAGFDLDDESIRFPKDLRRQHDKAMEAKAEVDAKETAKRQRAFIEKRRAKFEATVKAVERLTFEADGILIRPCRTEEELIREGKVLSHCVGGYADVIAEGKSAIFFIRRAEDPDTPWYTLELDPVTLEIRQNRGKKNCAETPEVLAFKVLWKKTMLEKKESAA